MRYLTFRTILAFVIATGSEAGGLGLWLRFTDDQRIPLGLTVLFVGLLIERIAVLISLSAIYRGEGLKFPKQSFGEITIGVILLAIAEVLIWLAWLFVAEHYGAVLGAVVLFVLMVVLHSSEIGILKLKGIFSYALSPKNWLFTLMETLGGAFWLHYVREDKPVLGIVILAVGLSIEHIIEGTELRPEVNKT
jgi:hypothetical protein